MIIARSEAIAPAQQASFRGLGFLPGGFPDSQASGISPDGNYVCGIAIDEFRRSIGFRWNVSDGMIALPGRPPNAAIALPTAIISNRVAVGSITPLGESRVAVKWVDTIPEELGWLGDAQGYFDSNALDVADTGVIVGDSTTPQSLYKEAFRWEDARMQGLGDLPGGRFDSSANAISHNGRYIVGSGITIVDTAEVRRATLWYDGQINALETPTDALDSAATDVTDMGVAVGTSTTRDFVTHPARWENGELMLLPRLPGAISSEPIAISQDGQTVVGNNTFGQIWIWDQVHGTRDLRVVFEQDYGLDLSDWGGKAISVNGMSTDAGRITGYGFNANGNREAWLATLPRDTDGDGLLDSWETSGLDINGDGTIDLDLPAMGANPLHKDLFVEVDLMDGVAVQHCRN